MTPLDLAEHDSAAKYGSPKLGRPMDATRDDDILEAAVDILAEVGFEGMTIDMVAARAKAGKATLYRRWPSKTELVIDAVACMKHGDVDYDNLPDTGTLRGDLVAMMRPLSIKDGEKKLKVMAGLVSLLARNPELADAAHAAIVEPRMKLNLFFMQRAIDRGEMSADVDLRTLALISPSMVSYRVLMLQKPVDREFLLRIIDHVVLPAAGISP